MLEIGGWLSPCSVMLRKCLLYGFFGTFSNSSCVIKNRHFKKMVYKMVYGMDGKCVSGKMICASDSCLSGL